MSESPKDNPDPRPTSLTFDAVLTAQRSLSRDGFLLLMALLGGVCGALGFAFLLMGAWPVVGFLGLDVVLVWVAFRLSYRAGRLTERLEPSEDSLTVGSFLSVPERRDVAEALSDALRRLRCLPAAV
jgi:uncharacterized membrane protein